MKTFATITTALLLAPSLAAPLAAQTPVEGPARTIQVSGTGVVRTVPDIALLVVYLRGEGATPDAATQALADKQKAVTGGLVGLLGADAVPTTGNVTIIEARNGNCPRGYDSPPRISTGDCAVTGYIATLQGNVRTANVAKAATAAGLAARLGASDARLEGYDLSDHESARTRASAAAITAARTRAEEIARGAGVHLGPVTSLRDEASGDIVVTGTRYRTDMAPPPMAAPAPPPIALDLKPRPIETRAQVYATYAILP